jgi:hypothetical protein
MAEGYWDDDALDEIESQIDEALTANDYDRVLELQSKREHLAAEAERQNRLAATPPPSFARTSDDKLVAWARGELAPNKITFAEANALGGPDNPKVAELARHGLIEGWEVPKERPLISEEAKAAYEDALRVQKEVKEREAKLQAEATERERDPRAWARRKALEKINDLPAEKRAQLLADAAEATERQAIREGRII